jgi:hypothetical protein
MMDEYLPDRIIPSHLVPDPVSRAFYHHTFRGQFFQCRGIEFQTLFSRLMVHAYGEHFSPSGTWGNVGDLKCDGYLHSQRRVFALYAPKDIEQSSHAKNKIRDDHAGALKHWREHMNRWTLVHNSDPSLPAPLLAVLAVLQTKEPSVEVREWDCEKLRLLLDCLDRRQLDDLFPGAPTRADLLAITHQDIKQAVDDLAVHLDMAAHPADSSEHVLAVPSDKAAYNWLSLTTQRWLDVGRSVTARVHHYFEAHTDARLAERVVNAFDLPPKSATRIVRGPRV